MQQRADMRQGGEATGAAPVGIHYVVDGRRLLVHSSGSGGPSVVFMPGAGLVGLDYLNIHDQVSAFTTSVLYDRAGTGWSDQVMLPRSAEAVTEAVTGFSLPEPLAQGELRPLRDPNDSVEQVFDPVAASA